MTDIYNTSRSLAEAFPEAQARIRRLRDRGKEIGTAGTFYVWVCDDLLARMDKAAAEQDVVAMVRTFAEAQEMKE